MHVQRRGVTLTVIAVLAITQLSGCDGSSDGGGQTAGARGGAGAGSGKAREASLLDRLPFTTPEWSSPRGDIESVRSEPTDLPPGVRLSDIPDPNVAAVEYSPLRLEDVMAPLQGGPRLTVSDLNQLLTYDFGCLETRAPVSATLGLANLGDAPLTVSRVYAGNGAITLSVGDLKLDQSGWLQTPLVLQPGQRRDLVVHYDPALEKVSQRTLAHYLQIFTNDTTKAMFSDDDPTSHETRIRLTSERHSRPWRRGEAEASSGERGGKWEWGLADPYPPNSAGGGR